MSSGNYWTSDAPVYVTVYDTQAEIVSFDGLPRVNEKLDEYGLPPVELFNEGVSTKMNIYRFKAINEAEKLNETIKTYSDTINLHNETINETIKSRPGINMLDLVQVTGRSRATVARAIAKLIRLDKIEHRGSKKTGGYYCKETKTE